MAEGYEPKPIDILVCQHQFSIESVTINSGSDGYLINEQTLDSLGDSALDPIPLGRTLKGVVLTWSEGNFLVAVNTLVRSTGKVNIRVRNFTPNVVTVTTVRVLAFWE